MLSRVDVKLSCRNVFFLPENAGSFSFTSFAPAATGLFIASEEVKDLIKEKRS